MKTDNHPVYYYTGETADDIAKLRARLAEAERLLRPFADAANDYTNSEPLGGGGLWWTDYASGLRGTVWTGGHINRRQLTMGDLKAAAKFFETVQCG